jgi:uncharacterized protein DUF732
MKFAIGASATAVFALVTIATAPLAAATPERDFIDTLTASGLTVPAAKYSQVVNGGHAVCSHFAKGATYQDAVAGVVGGLGGNRSLAATFVRAATNSFCPNYASELP